MVNPPVFIVQECQSPMLTDIMRQFGYEVHAFANGANFIDALQRAPAEACAIIDLDANLDFGMDLQKRTLDDGVFVPFIFLARDVTPEFCVTVLRRGATTVLQKPTCNDTLRNAVSEAIWSANAFRALAESGTHSIRLESLSQRERRIVHLAADGMPNKRIAAVLGLSVKTVEKQRRQAYQRLQVASTAEMTRAVTLGCLHPLLRCPDPVATQVLA